MHGIHAVYKLSEIRRLRESTPSPQRARESAPAGPRTAPAASSTETVDTRPSRELSTLREILHSHFVEEVRRRDRDGDGSLSRLEYGGEPETFTQIDADRDGLVDARDLIRVALDRNPELNWMVAGPWAPIYDRILNSKSPDEEQLIAAAADGARQASEREYDRGDVQVDSATSPDPNSTPSAAVDTPETPAMEEEILGAFLAQHPDLPTLHERLQSLADRLGRYRPYRRIDLFA